MTPTSWVLIAIIYGSTQPIQTQNYFATQEACLQSAADATFEFNRLVGKKNYLGVKIPAYSCIPAANGTYAKQ